MQYFFSVSDFGDDHIDALVDDFKPVLQQGDIDVDIVATE